VNRRVIKSRDKKGEKREKREKKKSREKIKQRVRETY